MDETYIDVRWRDGMGEQSLEQSPRLQASVRKVLNELSAEALLRFEDPRLEVRVVRERSYSVWAYFPMHRRRQISQQLHPKPETRVLLVFSVATFEEEPAEQFEEELRDHLGHVLLYLRKPREPNDCAAAMREWRSCLESRLKGAGYTLPRNR